MPELSGFPCVLRRNALFAEDCRTYGIWLSSRPNEPGSAGLARFVTTTYDCVANPAVRVLRAHAGVHLRAGRARLHDHLQYDGNCELCPGRLRHARRAVRGEPVVAAGR